MPWPEYNGDAIGTRRDANDARREWRPGCRQRTLGAMSERAGSASRQGVAFWLASSAILVATSTGGLTLLVQLFLKSQGASLLTISAASSLGSVGVLLGSTFWGRLSDRTGRRGLLIAAAVGTSASVAVLVALPGNLVVVSTSFLRAFMDIGFASMSLAMISAASRTATRARGMSYNSSARSLGFALGVLSAGFVLDQLGYRYAFLAMALLPMAAAAMTLRLPHEEKTGPAPRVFPWRDLRAAGLTRLYLATILRQFSTNGAFALLYVYMDDRGISATAMGSVSSLNTLTQVIALVFFGWLADRVGRRRVFLLGFALSAVLPCILAISNSLPMMAVSYVVLGLGFSSLYVGSTAHIGDLIPPERLGTMMGLFEMARGLGGLLGPLLAGALVTLVGYFGMFLTMAAVAGGAWVLVATERAAR
ncbi:MAG: MFS transporter [Candidatus Bipolaricaulota bacterium]